ncbi:MAG: Holliday junction resolvase RuvX [Aquabacterium sp.]
MIGSTQADSLARPAERRFLAFDYGTRRIGVAGGNSLTFTASPIGGIAAAERFERIAQLIAEWQPDALVVGVPRHPDGAPHEQTQRAQRFARQLHGRFRLPVHEVDERWTTTEALALGARDADAAAATLILEQHLRMIEGAPC